MVLVILFVIDVIDVFGFQFATNTCYMYIYRDKSSEERCWSTFIK